MSDSFTNDDRRRLATIRDLAIERATYQQRAEMLACCNTAGLDLTALAELRADVAENDAKISMLSRKIEAVTRGEA